MITPKKMEVYLKMHYSSDSIAREFGITESDLDYELRKIYGSKAYEDIQKRLRANNKKAKKLRKPKHDESNIIVFAEAETTTATEENISKPSKEDILVEIGKKKARIIELEQEHLKSSSRRKEIKNSLVNKKQELLTLQKQVQSIQKEVSKMLKDYTSEEEAMQKITAEINQHKDELSSLEEQYEELCMVSIFAYSNGSIEVDDCLLEEDPEGWIEIYQKFYGKDFLDNLTGAQVKQLAKILSYTKTLEHKFEICFESEEAQKVYENLV